MNLNEIKLVEKMVRAKMALENSHSSHTMACPAEDPHMAGPCRCGADKRNRSIEKALRELDFS